MDPDTQTHQLGEWRFKALIFTVILSAIGYLIVSMWGGWESVFEGIKKVGLTGTCIALGLSLINYFLRFLRWQGYLSALQQFVPFWKSFRVYIAGFSLTATPGKAGEALRSVFLHDYGVSYRKSFGALIAERFSDLFSILILATLSLWLYANEHANFRVVIVCVWIFIGLAFIILQSDSVLKKIEQAALKYLPNKFARSIEFAIDTVLAFKSCFSLKTLGSGTLLGLLSWGAEAWAFYLILSWLGAPLPLSIAVFIYSTSLLIGAITFLPGGLGGVEVSMLQLLIYYGVDHSTAAAATLLIRVTTLWFSILLGILFLPKKRIFLKEERLHTNHSKNG